MFVSILLSDNFRILTTFTADRGVLKADAISAFIKLEMIFVGDASTPAYKHIIKRCNTQQ